MNRIFGPPGTGKTTTLLNMVDKALESGTPPQQIAFLAFTRKAANEARERAATRFDLNPQTDLFFFRTIHSLAFKLLNINTKNLMQQSHYDELGHKIGFTLLKSQRQDFDEVTVAQADNPVLSMINLAKIKKTTLWHEYNRSAQKEDGYTGDEVDYISRSYEKYKNMNGLMDYTDMLVYLSKCMTEVCPRFKLCFLDEAQDLSPLQWDIAYGLDKVSDELHIAGDDDQAIYRWAGASPETFINLECDATVLDQSYRIPPPVHVLANRIIGRINKDGGQRFTKEYKPQDKPGRVTRVHNLNDQNIDFSQGNWLIMAQANYMLTDVAQQMKSLGFLYERNGARSISSKISNAVNTWEHLRKGGKANLQSVKVMYSYMSGNGKRIARGGKQSLQSDEFTYDQLVADNGLLVDSNIIWSEALDRIPEKERAYITALLRRGDKFNGKPRINLSTFHGMKGGECENVIIFPDLTQAALTTTLHIDDIHRVFYVAVTRTKTNLYVVEPEYYDRAYDLPLHGLDERTACHA